MAPKTRSNKNNIPPELVCINTTQNNDNNTINDNNSNNYLYHGSIAPDIQIGNALVNINKHDTPNEAARKTRINTKTVYIIGCNYLTSLLLDMLLKIFEYIIKGAKGINIIFILFEHLLSSIRAHAALIFNNKIFREFILPMIPLLILIWFIGFKPINSYKRMEDFTHSIGKYTSSGLYGFTKAFTNK